MSRQRDTLVVSELATRTEEIVEAASGGLHVTVTRDGAPSVVVLSAREFDRWERRLADLAAGLPNGVSAEDDVVG